MKNRPKISISNIILFYMAIIGSISVVSVGLLWAYFEQARFNQEAREVKTAYVASQEQILKREVDRAIAFAEYMQSQTEIRLKAAIKNRVYEAHAVATHIYRQHQREKSSEEIEQLIKDALRPIRFNQGRGYYFAFNLEGVETLFAAKPEMEGRNMLAVKGGGGETVVADMLALVQEKGQGFYQYTWSKPHQEGFFPKVAFVKRFEPLNWIIGTGEYLDDVENDIQSEVLQWISKIEFGKDGYVFAGRWDGLSLSGPAAGKNMLEITDANGVKIVQALISAARSGGGYVRYTLPEFEGKRKAPKISYAVALDDWRWYIGAGVYLDEIEAVIQAKQIELTRRIKTHMVFAALLLGSVLMVVLLFVKLISNRIHNNLISFTAFFRHASSEQVKIDPRTLYFSDFSDLAVSANEMIEKRNHAEKALKESQTWLRTLLDSIQSGLIVIDASNHHIIDVNQTALRLIGAHRERVVGRECWNFLCPSEKGACPITDLGETIEQSERVLMTADGREVPVLKSCNTLTIDDRQYIIESFLDLTEQKKLQDQLRQAHKLESLGLLAGGVSHDLNNMLSPVIGFSEIMLMGISQDDPHREPLEKIYSAGIKAKELVHQLLAFGRKQALEIQNVDINALIVELEQLIGRTIPENISLSFELDAMQPMVRADSSQLEQVLLNLMLNAQDAMPDGGRLAIETRQVYLDGRSQEIPGGLNPGVYVQLEITDTGGGIEPRLLEKIFDPFFTTKEKGKGTGLGLAMAYGIIKQHNGSIQVTSTIDQGTRFTIYLPVAQDGVEFQVKTDHQPQDFSGTETIMVVEDNDSVRDLACDILKKFGYTVLTASHAQLCLDVLASHQGDLHLVLTDVVMPDMNGRELFEKVKSRYNGVNVLFMSGYTDQIIARHGILEDGFHFVQKPFAVEALVGKIRHVLDAAG